MERRDFIKKAVLGTLATTIVSSSIAKPEKKEPNTKSNNNFDIVAIKGGTPESMFEQGIAALGGMEVFVKKGQKVLVKPNIGWDSTPERAANTNPELVKKIIEHCFKAGAKEVNVFDNTCNQWDKCYKNSGIEKAVKEAGGKIIQSQKDDYILVKSNNGKSLKEAHIHKLVMQCDVFINVPILKHHQAADLTIAMKNLMGIVWDRNYWHKNNLHQCIADGVFFRKPDLNIVDAYRVMKRNGPRGVSVDDVIMPKYQIISTDIVAADAAAAKVFGTEPAKVEYIKIAHEMGIGNMNLDNLNIKRINL